MLSRLKVFFWFFPTLFRLLYDITAWFGLLSDITGFFIWRYPKRKRVSGTVFEASSSSAGQVTRRASMLRSVARRNDVSVVDGSIERVKSVALSLRPQYSCCCCKKGNVVLQYPVDPPSVLVDLMGRVDFKNNIWAYNAMFFMTSFGARVDDSINHGFSPYVFKVSGQISHWIGSLCLEDGEKPRFLQIYIYDPLNEISNRMRFFSSGDGDNELDESVVISLTAMLDVCNRYVRLYRSARDVCNSVEVPEIAVALYSRVTDRCYESPTSGSVGAIICGGDLSSQQFDVIVHNKSNQPCRISRLHPSYMPLQYPLLFPYGEQGWTPDMQLVVGSDSPNRNLSPAMYYSYQIHEMVNVSTHV
ncbi:hypothetical protein QVD17_30760 [Tagetes erecta]|uniref:Helitron helicase-like domain-containing protein n=1 Tax=Tagetes erecta TaxID=13708 RepID=A0AAD8NNL3_TARER|nr:hypothetical protein QVD17_30760 [Tagetes erecta]